MLKKLGLGLLALALISGAALGAGLWSGLSIINGASYCGSYTNAVCTSTIPAGPALTGNELIPADTMLPNGQSPQTAYISLAAIGGLPYTYNAPLTGASITVVNTTGSLVLDPAGTIATLTVTLPAATTLIDGQIFRISSSQTVTALTLTGGTGTTISNAPTAITISTTAPYGYAFIYRTANTKWYRLQ